MRSQRISFVYQRALYRRVTPLHEDWLCQNVTWQFLHHAFQYQHRHKSSLLCPSTPGHRNTPKYFSGTEWGMPPVRSSIPMHEVTARYLHTTYREYALLSFAINWQYITNPNCTPSDALQWTTSRYDAKLCQSGTTEFITAQYRTLPTL